MDQLKVKFGLNLEEKNFNTEAYRKITDDFIFRYEKSVKKLSR